MRSSPPGLSIRNPQSAIAGPRPQIGFVRHHRALTITPFLQMASGSLLHGIGFVSQSRLWRCLPASARSPQIGFVRPGSAAAQARQGGLALFGVGGPTRGKLALFRTTDLLGSSQVLEFWVASSSAAWRWFVHRPSPGPSALALPPVRVIRIRPIPKIWHEANLFVAVGICS
jgi:hypothetical protein